uniref:AVO1 n=1 Tax=Ogataea thermomethanolica (nom. inval.) TaxID=310468 RepID=A0A5P8D0W1_9ASCO|nr:target of rapamycin complex 2 subunit AVO1 [Ogataea thermomethanolica (nom. inval.)]QGW56827.1 AVO1 [Ogataea thermomethanolica (nom. inval.)]
MEDSQDSWLYGNKRKIENLSIEDLQWKGSGTSPSKGTQGLVRISDTSNDELSPLGSRDNEEYSLNGYLNSDFDSTSLASSVGRLSDSLDVPFSPLKEVTAFDFHDEMDSETYPSSQSLVGEISDDEAYTMDPRFNKSAFETGLGISKSAQLTRSPKESNIDMSDASKTLNKIVDLSRLSIDFEKLSLNQSRMMQTSNLTSQLNEEKVGITDQDSLIGHGNLFRCTFSVPVFSIESPDPLILQVAVNLEVGGAIEFLLSKMRSIGKNYTIPGNQRLEDMTWNLYLADEDGQIDDDMGPLENNRLLSSYGVEEFVLVPKMIQKASLNYVNQNSGEKCVQECGSTKAHKITRKLSGITLDDRKSSLASNASLVSQLSSESILLKASRTQHIDGTTSVVKATNDPVRETAAVELPGKPDNRHMSKRKKKLQTLLQLTGLNGGGLTGPRGYAHNVVGESKTSDNFGLGAYHRWTVWRRQQMSFKGRYAKSLAIDGHQIYILPFNESKGFWYESKTTSFNVNQVLKVKQNKRLPQHFKIVVSKLANETPKTYHLEASNAHESKVIVDTLNTLKAQYKRGQQSNRKLYNKS